jgi:hypothetical protein
MTTDLAEARAALRDLLDLVPPCDENMHPAWCSNHLQKWCDGDAVIARGRAVLNEKEDEDAR